MILVSESRFLKIKYFYLFDLGLQKSDFNNNNERKKKKNGYSTATVLISMCNNFKDFETYLA